KGGFVRGAPERHAAWRPRARRTKYQVGSSYTEPSGSVYNASVRGMQGVAANASYDLSRAHASVTGQTTIAASTATTSCVPRLPEGFGPQSLVSPRRLTNAEADKRSVDFWGCAAASYLTRLQLSWGVDMTSDVKRAEPGFSTLP